MATFRKIGEFQWHTQIRKKGFPTQTRTFTHKKDAEAWANAIEREMATGAFIPRQESERTTVHDLIERYRAEVLPSKRGKHFSHALGVLDDAFGKFAVAAITSALVAKFRDSRIKVGLSASTIRKEINLLSKLLDLGAMEWGIFIPSNPCKLVSRPAPGKSRDRRLESGELEQLLPECEPHLALIVRFAIATGARLGELLALKWTDIDPKDNVMIVRGIDERGTKNGDEFRESALYPDALEVLEELKKLPGSIDRRIFHWWKASDSFTKSWVRAKTRAQIRHLKDQGTEIPTHYVKIKGEGDPTPRTGGKSIQQVNQASKRAKARQLDIDQLADGFLSDLRFHDLRREAASRMLERGHPPEVVSAQLGHRTAHITLQTYTRLRMREAAKKYS